MKWARACFGLVILALSVGCGDDGRRPGPGRDASAGDASSGPCTEGEIVCMGREVHVCRGDSTELVETCSDEQVCALGLGCRDCQPGRPFCSGQEIRVCSADGMSSELQMECPASQACRGAACVDACALAAEERSNVGCDYMLVDLDNEFANAIGGGASAASEQFAAVLANPSDVFVQAMVFQSVGLPNSPAETLVGTYMVPPNDLVRIDLPAREVDGSTPPEVEGPGTYLSNHAYRIRTNFPVVAYQFNPIIQSFSNDASLLLPVPALGSHYRVLGWGTANPIEPFGDLPGIPDHSYVTIVGTQPGTTVRVTLGGPIVGGGSQGGATTIPATPAGGVVEAVIGPYDVLNLESDMIPGDMSGTVVESSQPVAVFSGGERGIAPLDTDGVSAHPSGAPDDWCCTEHLEEQVFPTEAWGKDFVITRSPVRSSHATWREPDIYRILADKAGTTVTTSLPPPNDSFTLNENQWIEFSTDRPFIMNATQPVSIQQMLVSQGWVVNWRDGHGGDPSMILFPPYEQYRESYIFLAPDTFTANYVVLAAPGGADITLDDIDIDADEFMRICEYEEAGVIDGIPYTQVTCPIEGGTHRVESTLPVGIMVYGYHSVGSYGYAGGSNLTRINPLI